MILRRGEEREAWRKFHGAELNEKRKSLEEKHHHPQIAGANKISRRLFCPFRSIRFSPLPSPPRKIGPLPEEKRKGDDEERKRERERRRLVKVASPIYLSREGKEA